MNSEEFMNAAKGFVEISNRICDGWRLFENSVDIDKSYIKKLHFIELENDQNSYLLKAEFVVFFNVSYGVPSFSFNIWNSAGKLLTLEEIREMTLVRVTKEEFYSVITQQEHPLFFRPYYIVHPCQTENLLSIFKNNSKNIIVTFLSLISPLIKLNMPLEYAE